MKMHSSWHRGAMYGLLIALLVIPSAAQSNVVDEEKGLYVIRPLITEAPFVRTGAYLKSFLFDMPNAVSRPNAQVGFVFTPGFTWSVLDILELNVGFPLVINPDPTGDAELDAADADPGLKDLDSWDSHPDFDLPGIQVGLKGRLLGSKAEDRFFLAAGVMANIVIEDRATNFMQWKNGSQLSSPYLVSPYITLAYTTGRFSPHLQAGANFRFSAMLDPDNPGYYKTDAQGNVDTKMYTDLFLNLALPFAFPFEGTAPMLEFNAVYNPENQAAQVFITPAVTFIPKGSAASLGFACMLPILDSDFRDQEGFRFLVNFNYNIDALAIPGPQQEDDSEAGMDEHPPAGW